jgi:hypothetical protein
VKKFCAQCHSAIGTVWSYQRMRHDCCNCAARICPARFQARMRYETESFCSAFSWHLREKQIGKYLQKSRGGNIRMFRSTGEGDSRRGRQPWEHGLRDHPNPRCGYRWSGRISCGPAGSVLCGVRSPGIFGVAVQQDCSAPADRDWPHGISTMSSIDLAPRVPAIKPRPKYYKVQPMTHAERTSVELSFRDDGVK